MAFVRDTPGALARSPARPTHGAMDTLHARCGAVVVGKGWGGRGRGKEVRVGKGEGIGGGRGQGVGVEKREGDGDKGLGSRIG